MKISKHILVIVTLCIALSTALARAECAFSPFSFFPDRNDTVHVQVATDNESYCDNSFREGPGYRFTNVSVTKAPRHGVIATLGPNHFAYHPFANYHGNDQYTIRACAIVGQRKGCSTLIYEVMVR
jgi:hypothetical protein